MSDGTGFSPHEVENAPAVLAWKELTVKSSKSPRPLLHKVAGRIAGGFSAVMGPSGSGRSSNQPGHTAHRGA